jgi:non-specific serine/threonine protein kinase
MKPAEPTPAALTVEPPDGPIASVARALAPGAVLDEFEVAEVIGAGSTAIVYAATDRAREATVAIAEYMPARLAQRHEAQVTPRSPAQADAFAKGLKAFVNETRALARCNHPSLMRVGHLWEANGTAYRLMPRYPATRLLDVRQRMSEPPGEEAVRAMLDALLGALGAFHLAAGGGHGKVTPSNILLLDDNRPLLLGPGAAGRAIAGDRIDALMTSEEPCFAPIEQMVESADIPLRPSVDLYALAGVARYWISGELPAPVFSASGTPRREKLADTVQRMQLTWPRLHYSAALLDALDNALSIYPAERPQSVAQMRARLGTAPAAAGAPARAASTAASTAAPAQDSGAASRPAAAPQLAASAAVPASPTPAPPPAPKDAVSAPPAPAPPPALRDAVPASPTPAPQPALKDAVPASPTPAPQPALKDAVLASPAPAPQPALNDAVPAPLPQPLPPDRVTQDFDVVMSSTSDPDLLATAGLAGVDGDPSLRTTFARQARRPGRSAKWSGAVLVLLALLLVGVLEFGQEGPLRRVLDIVGIRGDTAVGDSAPVPAPAVTPAATPPPPPVARDAADAKPTAAAAADSAASAAAPASPASAPIDADAASTKPMPTEATATDSPSSATAPASSGSAPIAADTGVAKSGSAAPDAAASATAAASPAGSNSTTPSATAPAASAEPAPITQPPRASLAPSPPRAQQRVARAPASPREVCGPRTQFSLYRCMKVQCSQRRWVSHAQCQRLRQTDSVD